MRINAANAILRVGVLVDYAMSRDVAPTVDRSLCVAGATHPACPRKFCNPVPPADLSAEAATAIALARRAGTAHVAVRSARRSSSKIKTPRLATAAPSSANLPTPPKGKKWLFVPSLSDEFNGAQLDTTKWMPRHPYWEGRQPSAFKAGNVRVADGLLQLNSTSRVANMSEVADPLVDVWVDSAVVSSVAQTAGLGYYEARVKASRLSMSSSFWFQGSNGEIDVIEQVGSPTDSSLAIMAEFMMPNVHTWRSTVWTDYPQYIDMNASCADDFHVYGMWWKGPYTVQFFLDNVLVATVRTKSALASPMWMFFDTEAFSWMGLPSISSLQDPTLNRMLVDYVRAWKL